MYNRYIPQADGSYQRNRIEEILPESIQKPSLTCNTPAHPPEPCKAQKEPPSCPCPRMHPTPTPVHQKRHRQVEPQKNSVSSFFKHLLPKDFDTSDLLIILLLLIISGDCAEDQNTALLTLVLYLFL